MKGTVYDVAIRSLFAVIAGLGLALAGLVLTAQGAPAVVIADVIVRMHLGG